MVDGVLTKSVLVSELAVRLEAQLWPPARLEPRAGQERIQPPAESVGRRALALPQALAEEAMPDRVTDVAPHRPIH